METCKINVTGGDLPAAEIEAYKRRAVEKDRFNDAKRAEERNHVKHGVSCDCCS